MSIEFSRKLIKGRIAEVIFEQMIREEGRYTVSPFGYEHTMPTLAQYRHLAKIQAVINNISEAPDFALISDDKTEVFLVEVKFQTGLNFEEIRLAAQKLLERWDYPWIFVATPDGFYCGMCEWIVKEEKINELSEGWVAKLHQHDYLKLLKEFNN